MQHEIGIKLSASGGAQVKSTLQQFNADMGALGSRVDTVRTAIGGLGPVLAGTLSVGALTAWVKSSIEAMDALNDAADATGATIEELSKLEVIALRNGDSLDTVTTAMIKLNKELASTDGKNGASLALQELGLEAEKLRRLSPAEAWREVAIALNGVEAGGAKARLQYELLGKSTRELAANLKDVAESGDVAATITTQQAQEAEKFAKAMSLLSTNVSLAARSLVSEMIPALTDTLDKFNRFQAGGTISGFWTLLKTQFAEGQIQAQREELERLMDVLAGNKLPENESYWVAQIKEARQELDRLTGAASAARGELNAALGISNAGGGRGFVNPETVKRQVRDMQDLTAAQKAAEAAAKASAEAMKKAEKLRADSIAYATRITDDAAKSSNAYADSLEKAAESLDTENQRLRDQYIELTAGKEALASVVALRLEERAVALERAADATGWEAEAEQLRTQARLLREQIALRQGITEATASQEAQRANTEAAQKAADKWQRASDQVGQALADALMQGGKSAADYIKGLFRTMVLRPVIQAAVQPYANAVLGLMGQQGQGATGQAGQYLQGAQSLQTLYGYGQAGYGYLAANGYFGSAAAAYVSPAAAQAAYGGAAAEIAGSGAGASATSGTASMASYAGWVAAIAAGVYRANQDYSNGYNIGGARQVGRDTYGVSGTFEATQADLLKSLGISDRLASLLSGSTAVAALIGRAAPQVTGSGIQGSFGGGAFSGQAYADIYEKGGLFRSGNAYQSLTALPEDLARFMDEAASGVMDKAEEFGAALGLPVAELSKITTDIKLNLGDSIGNNAEDITNALAAYGDALVAGWAEALKPVAIYGETTLQTIERVGEAIKATNDVLGLLEVPLLAASVAGGQAAAALADSFGGLDKLQAASAAYYQEFFSEEERKANALQALTEVLGGVGLAVPNSREAFRDLVSGLDLTSEAGREQFAVMMNVAGAFAELNPIIEETAAAVSKAAEAFANAMQGLAADAASLEVDLLRASGNAAAARALERSQYLAGVGDVSPEQLGAIAAAYDYNQALREQITALEDAATAAEEAAQRAAEVESERAGLQRQLLDLQGDTAAIRALEREALDESNRSLYDQITALQDLKTAADESARAAERAAKAQAMPTAAEISASADAMTAQQAVVASRADVQARIEGGQYGQAWAEEFDKTMALYSGASATAQTFVRNAFINGALVSDAMSQRAQAAAARGDAATSTAGGYSGSLIEDQIKSTNDLIESLHGLSAEISSFRDDLTGSALDPASPEEKYASERALAESLAAQAATGDAASVRAFEAQAREFLGVSQSFYGSTAEYAADFSRMVALLDAIQSRLEKQAATASATLAVQQSGLSRIAENTESSAEATGVQARAAAVLAQRAVE